RAWRSDALADCPTFGEWLIALPERIRPSLAPFRFRNGREAGDLQDLVRLCQASPEDGIWHLERGDLEPWLRDLGLEALAQTVARIRESAAMGPEKLKQFLDATGVRHSYNLPEPAPPPPPPPSAPRLEDLRAQVYALNSQGQWREVLNLCNAILSRWPDQEDIAVLSFRARHLAGLEEKLEQAWQQAMQSGKAEDWEACWKAARTILQHVPQTTRYQEMAERAQREMEWAAIVKQAEALLADGHLDEAEALLTTVPPDHLAAGQVRAQIEAEHHRRRRIEDLLQNARDALDREAWDEAIVAAQTGLALGGSTDRFQSLLEQARRERETDRQVARHLQEADRLAQAGEWDPAIAQVDQALALRPHRAALRSRREELLRFKEWAHQLTEARQALRAHEWDRAWALVAPVPDDFLDAAALQAEIQGELRRREALQEARRRYDVPQALAFLADVPPDYPDLEEWRRWAQAEQARREQLEEARKAYDGQRVLDLLADVSPDYPDLEALRAWAEAEIRRREQLDAALAVCDGQQVLEILDNTPADYPRAEDLRRQAEEWIARQHALEEAWNGGRWEEALTVLNALPSDYPDRDRRIQEATQALRQQRWLEQAEAAFAGGRWEDVIT
ncbi:MAG: hypothetical protein ACPLYD_16175, partial [Anaerolineae bacterium]